MFKKPLSNLKTSAPLRSSDRRKLKQRIVAAYGLTGEEGDALVPDGILSLKFSTHINEPGVAYIGPNGDPLWFTIGKASEDLIPTVYTLWKKEDLLPFLSTPAAVIPILIGGADLMIPGVMHCPPSLREHQLVAIRQYVTIGDRPALSPPVVIGRMALPSDQLRSPAKEKGKAVLVVHAWKDFLFDMGSKTDLPPETILTTSSAQEHEDDPVERDEEGETATSPPPSEKPPSPTPEPVEAPTSVSYTAGEVTELLNKALLQVISTTLKSLPSSSFPIPATLLYTNHILPSRPAFPTLVISPASWPEHLSSGTDAPHIDTDITIKTSSHKSLTTFLKAAEKNNLLTLKSPQKQQPDVLVTLVNASHPDVIQHTPFVTVKDLELKAAKKTAREEKEKESQSSRELEIKELWKPHQSTVELFEGMGGNKSDLLSAVQIRSLLNSYIAANNLVNVNDQAYINLDELLYSCLSAKSKGKGKAKDVDSEELSKFMKRDELTKTIIAKMQSWHAIRAEGKDPVTKKGSLAPIQVVMKVRQGRKASTLISGFEPFLVIDAEEMAEDLRKACAGSTSVSPIPGKTAGYGLEVLVQGKQSGAVVEYLTTKGIPKKWIEVADLSGKR
ncbi:hypothetical protein M413DRAFT_445131 [Hebeloma cylindrosporum]|uniref:Uncharacterized protein n=1 Tax=Hebeloma cylindrosporum TaxID=76867 RepID=A0A0C2YLL9_HEBCY|nr:hypothetical protein M413DRAFT_445131 [Hebeloma cylindrosporum h7]